MFRHHLFAVAIILSCTCAQAQHENLLPEKTIAAFSFLNLESWNSRNQKSPIIEYLSDDAIKNSLVGESNNDNLLSIFTSIQLTKFASGQVTVAILDESGSRATVILVDCKDAASTNNFLNELITNSARPVSSSGDNKFVTLKDNSKLFFGQMEKTAIVTTSNSSLKNVKNAKPNYLSHSGRFKSTVARAKLDLDENDYWIFANINSLLRRKPIAKNLQVALKEGLADLDCFGGYGTANPNYSSHPFVGYVTSKMPLRRGMQVLNFTNEESCKLPKWTTEFTSRGLLNTNPANLRKSISSIFDAFIGEGEEGIFETVLEDLKNDGDGPQVDLDRELFANLSVPVFFGSKFVNSENVTVISLKLLNQSIVVDTLTRFYAEDHDSQKLDCDFAAWKVRPLEIANSNSRKPYVVAVRNGHLFFSPNLAEIERIDSGGLELEHVAGIPESVGCGLVYQIAVNNFAEYKHNQIGNGKVDGLIRGLFREINFDVNKVKDRWPAFNQVSNYFDSNLTVIATSRKDGFKILIGNK